MEEKNRKIKKKIFIIPVNPLLSFPSWSGQDIVVELSLPFAQMKVVESLQSHVKVCWRSGVQWQ